MAENDGISELEQLRRDVKKEVTQQAAKWLVGAAIAAVALAATGWWLYLKPKLVEIAGGVPAGVVAAFDTPKDCPSGWTAFEDAAGRTIIGTGKAQGLTWRRYREQGGEEAHVLTVEEMPVHRHDVVQMIHDDNVNGVDDAAPKNYEHHNATRPSGPAGSGVAHNNMPPYLALRYCRKQ